VKKYVITYHAPKEAVDAWRQQSQEESQRMMTAWFDWQNKIGDALLDEGTPFGKSVVVSQAGTAESTKELLGYAIIQAEDKQNAIDMVATHPHILWRSDCTMEVNECLDMPSHG